MTRSLVLPLLLIAAASRSPSQDAAVATPAGRRIHNLAELRSPQIDAFNRDRTMFILPIGMLEQHGPHLPIGADTLGVNSEAARAARLVSRSLPEWTIVMMPSINYGQGGANRIGQIAVHPGTYAIRQSTLRSVVADIGAEVARRGFAWIFVLNGHGAPLHNAAINDACDLVSETFGIRMLHITALFRADEAIQSDGRKIRQKFFSAAELESFGMDVHAGVEETSGMLALRPDLVDGRYKSLPTLAGQSFEELAEIAARSGWQGYFSAPAKATAAYGRALGEWWAGGSADLILRAVRGEDMFKHPRLPPPDLGGAALREILERMLREEREFEETLARWLAQRKKN